MKLRFTKMNGLGNDFVMVDAISQKINITPERAAKLADRRLGVGCDQVLVVESPHSPDADFRYRIFNHDGSEVENCGNGARCFAIFVRQRKLTGKKVIRAETAGGELILYVLENNHVRVDMGAPILQPSQIPYLASVQATTYPLALKQQVLTITAVSMGNPHAVTVVDNVAGYDVTTVGAEVELHPDFPNKVNAGFMEVVSRTEIRLRVFERGSGETLACGTGACAAVVAGQLRGLLDPVVSVCLPIGSLSIEWQGLGTPVLMTGPVTTVFHGQVNL